MSTNLWRVHLLSPQLTCPSIEGYRLVIVLWILFSSMQLQRTQSLEARTQWSSQVRDGECQFPFALSQGGLLHDSVSTHPSKSGRGEPNVSVSVGPGGMWSASVVAGGVENGSVAPYWMIPERGRWEGREQGARL